MNNLSIFKHIWLVSDEQHMKGPHKTFLKLRTVYLLCILTFHLWELETSRTKTRKCQMAFQVHCSKRFDHVNGIPLFFSLNNSLSESTFFSACSLRIASFLFITRSNSHVLLHNFIRKLRFMMTYAGFSPWLISLTVDRGYQLFALSQRSFISA